jgi:plastocyanin
VSLVRGLLTVLRVIRVKSSQETIPGSGLPAAALAALLAASVALFLVYNGLLWKAPREASHVARFAVSYLAVVPLAAGMLLAFQRFTWAHLVTSTGVVWAAKLVVTAVLYQALARGTATNLRAIAPPPTTVHGVTTAASHDYESVGSGSFAQGSLRGRVRLEGAAVTRAIVFLERPRSGRPLPARETIDLAIAGAKYAEPSFLVHTGDLIRFINHDALLHTARFSGPGALPATVPLPPGSEAPPIAFTEGGVYRVRCDSHPGESAWIVVVDHPYATFTAPDGTYALEGVPVGEARVTVVLAGPLTARETSATTLIRSAETVELDLDLDAAREIVL